MNRITEQEFSKICSDLREDRDVIRRHNPIGTPDETMFWMLLSVLVSYLSLSDLETPCFNGPPTAETYRNAIMFVLKDRMFEPFDAESYLDDLIKE